MKNILIQLFSILLTITIYANNIQVSTISLTDRNEAGFVMVQFDLNWQNSWRLTGPPSNWDAAWVFVKYRVNSGSWNHAFLDENGHFTGTGTNATISAGLVNTNSTFHNTNNPAMGVFIHRTNNGSGTFSQTGIKLKWNYSANSVSIDEEIEVKVFAVEMVYVPESTFMLGDGSTSNLNGRFRMRATNTPFTVSSEDALTLGGTGVTSLLNNNASGMQVADDFNNSTTRVLPSAFPKGFNAFYCMKYEISQQQWLDFFNTLDNSQMINRDITQNGTFNIDGKNSDNLINRNNIAFISDSAFLNSNSYGEVACNFINYTDGAAFCDWAGLRPMSEFEFEKACRGPLIPVVNQSAMGVAVGLVSPSGILSAGQINEIPSNSTANVSYNIVSLQGPLRVGAFATNSSNRIKSGGSFYGIMELSGNLRERTISVGHPVGRIFTSNIHGNGQLTSDGFCDISTWPGYNGSKVVLATGTGLRGGCWSDTGIVTIAVSNRIMSTTSDNSRNSTNGFRGVRTAQ